MKISEYKNLLNGKSLTEVISYRTMRENIKKDKPLRKILRSKPQQKEGYVGR